jgi:hypothetical protein
MLQTLALILSFPLGLVAMLCIVQLPAVIVSRFERRSVWPYENLVNAAAKVESVSTENPYAPPSVPSIENIPLNSYARHQLELATQNGFTHLRSTADQNKKLVQVRYEFLVSRDRKILAIVGFGKVAAIPVRSVFMMSQLDSGVFFTTLGAHAACGHDLNQRRTEMLVLGANFDTMLHYHQQRCSLAWANVKPFSHSHEIHEFHQYRIKHFADYEQRGFIWYLRDDQLEWKYTWKGAFLFVLLATVRQLRRTVLPDRWLREPMLSRVSPAQ